MNYSELIKNIRDGGVALTQQQANQLGGHRTGCRGGGTN